MLARHEELPTLPLPRIIPRRPVVLPRVLAKAKIVIEVPLGHLDERELLQAVEWLHGRDTTVLVETSLFARVRSLLRALVRRFM